MNARKYNDGQRAYYLAMVVLVFLIFSMLCGCNVQKRIEQAKIDAVTLDHAQNPCANDTTILTTPGETLVLIDTVRTHTTDTLAATPDTIQTTITITKRRIDTVMAVVVDKRLVNDYKDSVAKYKLLGAELSGKYIQQGETLKQAHKQARNLLIWLISLCVGIVIGIVLWIVIKIRP